MRYIAILAVILLTGCASKGDMEPICPKTGFIGRTDTIAYLKPGSVKDVVATASIRGFSGECRFEDKKKEAIEVSLSLPFYAQKGSAAAADLKEKELSYFIAVLSPDETILQRQAFTTKVSFDNTGTGNNTEEHTVKIPLKHIDADKYKVIIGFALTRDQLKYNEEHQK